MPDDPTAYAIDVVAREVIAHQIGLNRWDWEDFPELGEHDWQAVANRVRSLVAAFTPTRKAFEAAYEHLSQRAEGVEAFSFNPTEDRP